MYHGPQDTLPSTFIFTQHFNDTVSMTVPWTVWEGPATFPILENEKCVLSPPVGSSLGARTFLCPGAEHAARRGQLDVVSLTFGACLI